MIAASTPFPDASPPPATRALQVAFLRDHPPPAKREQVLTHATTQHRLAFGRRELLWRATAASAGTRLNLRTIERLVGPWTMRTMGTVE